MPGTHRACIALWSACPSVILLKCYTRSGWAIWDSSRQGHTEGEQMKKTLPRAGPLEGLSSGSWTMMRPWRGWQHRTAAACSQSQEMLELLWLGFWSSVIVYEITNTKHDRFSRIHRALIPGIFTKLNFSRENDFLIYKISLTCFSFQNYIFWYLKYI